MADREKVIKGLEFHKNRYCGDIEEGLCPYWSQEDCVNGLASDALVLMKEQETTNTGKERIFECEKCGYGIVDIFLNNERKYGMIPIYCPYCGRLVK